MPLTPGTILGQYEIRSPLGAGGMGEVYRAHDTRLDREVAIKVLPESLTADPDRVRRFEQEARAAAALNHPNILAVYQMATHEGVSYMVSELLDGETLRERLKRGPIPLRKAIDYAVQIARGLAAAHDKSIVHRDLKPDNLFVTKDGRVKILDFGLAKLTQPRDASGAEATMAEGTEPGMVMGTVGYMSPEQIRGKMADHRSDIFAFGTILYEMVTGKQTFRKPTSAETMTAILNEDPPPHAFVLDAISTLSPYTRPMFGCLAIYVKDKIVLILRDKPKSTADNGVWLATTQEHHQSLRREFPNMRSIQLLGNRVTGWQVLPVDAPDFESAALRACDLVLAGDPRIGKIPGARTSKSGSKATGRSLKQIKSSKNHGSTINFDTVRKIGLVLPGVEGSTAYGSPALKVRRELLACVPTHRSAEPDSLVVRIGFDDRAELLAADPNVYYVTDHYLNYTSVLVRLSRVTPDVLRDLLGMAHKFVTADAARRSPSPNRRKTV